MSNMSDSNKVISITGYSSGWNSRVNYDGNSLMNTNYNENNGLIENVSFDSQEDNNNSLMEQSFTIFMSAVNGAGLGVSNIGESLIPSNPVLGLALTVTGLLMSNASDDSNGSGIGSNTLYALLSCTGLENRMIDFMKRGGQAKSSLIESLPSAMTLTSNIGYGTFALTGANMIVQILSGKSVKEVLSTSSQTLLESTVWTVTGSCLEVILTPYVGEPTAKILSQSAASVATTYCTAPFTDENGNVSQAWCGAAEVGIVGGIAGGTYAAAAIGLSVVPGAAVVLGAAALGYFLVVGIKSLVDLGGE